MKATLLRTVRSGNIIFNPEAVFDIIDIEDPALEAEQARVYTLQTELKEGIFIRLRLEESYDNKLVTVIDI